MRFGVWRPLLGLLQGESVPSPQGAWRAEWTLSRHGAHSRAHERRAAVGLALVSCLLVVACWFAGLGSALQLVVADALALGAMLLVHRRHATDCDHIAMNPSLVRVEHLRAGRVSRVEFHPRWVRVEPDLHDGSLVRISGQGRSVVVGGYLPRAERPLLAEEFRWALRHLDD